jgi:hypothetical protein
LLSILLAAFLLSFFGAGGGIALPLALATWGATNAATPAPAAWAMPLRLKTLAGASASAPIASATKKAAELCIVQKNWKLDLRPKPRYDVPIWQ